MNPHACDETCVCPIHETPLIYAPSVDDHACQDVTCVHGHGMKSSDVLIVNYNGVEMTMDDPRFLA